MLKDAEGMLKKGMKRAKSLVFRILKDRCLEKQILEKVLKNNRRRCFG